MFYTIIALFVFVFALLIERYKYKYTWVFIIMATGMNLAIFSLTLFIYQLGRYQPINMSIFKLDYNMFIYFTNVIKLNYFTICRLYNIGIVIFLYYVPLFVYEYDRSRYNIKGNSVQRKAKLIVFIVMPLLYLWFYAPETHYNLYVIYHTKNMLTDREYFKSLISIIDKFNNYWVLLYLLYPIYLLFLHYRKTTVVLIKKHTLALGCGILTMVLFFYYYFFISHFKIFHTNYDSLTVLPDTTMSSNIPFYFFSIIPIVVLISLQILLFILTKYGMMGLLESFKGTIIKKNIRGLNNNLRGVFHSFKNIFLTIKIHAEQIEGVLESEDALYSLQRIKDISSHSFQQITRVLNSLKELNIKPVCQDMTETVSLAVNSFEAPDCIGINKNISEHELLSYFDRYHLTEAVKNLMQNSVEAIMAASRGSGIIEIDLFPEDEWIVIRVSDNGAGIAKRDKTNIFKPFFSVRSKHNNWGIGLSYVYKVIKCHMGYINVSSEPGRFTVFEILLPRVQERRK